MMIAFLSVTSGVLLTIVALVDIITTVLHPERESPLSTHFQRLVWRILNLVQRVLPIGRRGILLNWGLPLMVAGLIAIWLALLMLGFGLIYLPWIDDPRFFSANNPIERTLLNAMYYSGVTLATLGYGDIQPLAPVFRMLSVVQAITGAVTIASGVAYVLAVYPTVTRRRIIAVALDAEVAGHADALPMVRRYLGEKGQWHTDLDTQLRDLGLQLLEMTEAHETHSVLYYAHPSQVQHSFLRILVITQNLVGLLRYGLSPDKHRDIVYNPQLLLLEQSLHYSLRRLSASMHIPLVEELDEHTERERLAEEFETLCTKLEQIDLASSRFVATGAVPVLIEAEIETETEDECVPQPAHERGQFVANGDADVQDPALDLNSNSPRDAYIAFRLNTDPHINAYAAVSGYSIREARADYTTVWWVGRKEDRS